MSNTPHRLLIQSGANAGREHELVAPSITIGRYPLADIVIEDPDIAYRHALLTRGDASYRIADLGSESGTYVNGQRVGADPVALTHGDIVLLGSRLSAAYLAHAIEPVFEEEPAAEAVIPTGDIGALEEGLSDAPTHGLEDSGEMISSEYEPPIIEIEEPPADSYVTLVEGTTIDEVTPGAHHPGPLPAMPPPQKNKTGRIILITTGCLIALLACCCSSTLFMYFIGGDWLLNQLGYLP